MNNKTNSSNPLLLWKGGGVMLLLLVVTVITTTLPVMAQRDGIPSGSDWSLEVNLAGASTQSSVDVQLFGPQGYAQSFTTDPISNPTVVFVIPGNGIHIGDSYKVCVHGHCKSFIHNPGDESVSIPVG